MHYGPVKVRCEQNAWDSQRWYSRQLTRCTLSTLNPLGKGLSLVTGSSGTNDRIDWHVFSEVNGQPHEWTWPDDNAPAENLFRADENFCCKTWNFHLRGHDIFLAEEIYYKDEDGNCCPSRGGVKAESRRTIRKEAGKTVKVVLKRRNQ